jgi:hypothetical protein
LNSRPEEDLTNVPMNRLTRWKRLQKITQDIWKFWSIEYLHQLQERTKRFKDKIDVQIGDLVVVIEDNLPPMKWLLGRVVTLHPGKDGLVRVATIKTSKGEIKRPTAKLCLLPVEREAFQDPGECCKLAN